MEPELITTEQFYKFLQKFVIDNVQVKTLVQAMKSELYSIKANQSRIYQSLDIEKNRLKQIYQNELICEAGFDSVIKQFQTRFEDLEIVYAQEAEVLRKYIKRILDVLIDFENTVKQEEATEEEEPPDLTPKIEIEEEEEQEQEEEIQTHRPHNIDDDITLVAKLVKYAQALQAKKELTKDDKIMKQKIIKRINQIPNKTLRNYFVNKSGMELI